VVKGEFNFTSDIFSMAGRYKKKTKHIFDVLQKIGKCTLMKCIRIRVRQNDGETGSGSTTLGEKVVILIGALNDFDALMLYFM
jgi:hypothetical protein